MDPVVDEAVCLRQWDFSETSQTAVLFTRKLGIVRVLGKGTRRNDPRFSGGLEVGTLGEAVVYPKESGLATLAGWDLQQTFRGSRGTLAKHRAAMFAIDVPRHVLPEAEPHPVSYAGLVRTLGDLGGGAWQPVIARWLWLLLADAGFGPDLSAGERSVGFSPSRGGLVPAHAEQGAHGVVWRLRGETTRGLVSLASDVDAAGVLDPDVAERVGRLLAWYVREIAGREPPTLPELFGTHDPAVVLQDG
ncbi:MAG: DNA repair protein RecO [Planctomycetota bacterium]